MNEAEAFRSSALLGGAGLASINSKRELQPNGRLATTNAALEM